MFVPLQYQVSEYDCVPTAFMNAMSFLFHRSEIPPMVVRHIYLYSLDTVGKNARFGIRGTSRLAVQLLGSWLASYKIKRFSVSTEFLEKESVTLKKKDPIQSCLNDGGVALTNILLTPREEHYVMIMAIRDDWVYCFDSYRRTSIRKMKAHAEILVSDDGRSPNLRIRRQWMAGKTAARFRLGPLDMRESLLIRRVS